MKCNYPDCDGGSATGYCHNDCRVVPCEHCGAEGVTDHGACTLCEGSGSEIVEVQPIEMEDLDI